MAAASTPATWFSLFLVGHRRLLGLEVAASVHKGKLAGCTWSGSQKGRTCEAPHASVGLMCRFHGLPSAGYARLMLETYDQGDQACRAMSHRGHLQVISSSISSTMFRLDVTKHKFNFCHPNLTMFEVGWIVETSSKFTCSSNHVEHFVQVERRPPVQLLLTGLQFVLLRFDEELHVKLLLSLVMPKQNLRTQQKTSNCVVPVEAAEGVCRSVKRCAHR
uniref:DUF3778 domain-containing protein n=1 Tax=Oryza punctata TaxID=4537 RepID=A0A0E0KBF0_ORYPU